MRRNFSVVFCICLILMLVLSGCNLGVSAPSGVEELPTEVPLTETEIAPIATEVQTEVPHVVVPGELPSERSGLAGDQDSSSTADENRAPAGDRFTSGRYERPFNANEMDVYYPDIDILSSEVYEDATWLYGIVAVKDNGSGCSLNGKYGFEVDTNIDGGGDYLVMVTKPAATEWGTTGVEVWFDENNDVGGAEKVRTDASSSDKNGYETQLFGVGVGADPDFAWARISPEDPCAVLLAVKRTILDGNTRYMIGMWAGNDLFAPALFDQNDGFTHEQAGSSLIEFEYFYPLKEVYELDNACRMAIGFQPTGNEPGLCPLPPGQPQQQEEVPPPPGDGGGCPPPSILYCSPNGCFCLEPAG
jgi:hypothetical protein